MYQLSNVLDAYFGNVLCLSTLSTASITTFVGLRPSAKFATGATLVANPPMMSVLARIMSRSFGASPLYLILAAWMMSAILTPEGHATSHLLQFRQYLSVSSKKRPFFRRSLSPSGPACFGPGYIGFTGTTGQYTVHTVHLMHCSKLFVLMFFSCMFMSISSYFSSIPSAAARAVSNAMPPPQPSYRVLLPPMSEPIA